MTVPKGPWPVGRCWFQKAGEVGNGWSTGGGTGWAREDGRADWTVYWFMLPVCVVVSVAMRRVPEDTARRLFTGLFVLIGLTFLLVFTVFASRFA